MQAAIYGLSGPELTGDERGVTNVPSPATPFVFAMSVCTVVIQRGGPGYLNVLVMLFAWNALKFVVIGMLSPAMQLRSFVQGRADSDHQGMMRSTVR